MLEFCPKCHPILPYPKIDNNKKYGCKCEQKTEGLKYRIKFRYWDGGMGAIMICGHYGGVDGITYNDKELAQKAADKMNKKARKDNKDSYYYPEYFVVDNTTRKFWD
jgi:hypothetical protein